MPIDPEGAKARVIIDETDWTAKDVVLYHLSLGAGADPMDPRELRYASTHGDVVVLPSWSVSPTFRMMPELMNNDALDFGLDKVLHGQHDLVVHRPVPARARVVNVGQVVDVWDKRKAAIVVAQVKTYTRDDAAADRCGDLLTTNTFSIFVRGEGGFGGASGPRPAHGAPERAPDVTVRTATLPQQALWHRLNGDDNPLHVDPTFAGFAGFERPILHGLCSYGIALKQVVDTCLDGEPERVARFVARFSGIVLPGDRLETQIWRNNDHFLVSMVNVDRDRSPVISNAAVWSSS